MARFSIKALKMTGTVERPCASSLMHDAFRSHVSGLGFARGAFPAVDVCETEEALLVYADISGVSPETLELGLTERELTLKGRRLSPWQDGCFSFYRMEIGYGGFERTLRLPVSVDVESADVSFQNGMLLIKLEKIKAQKIIVTG